MGHWGRHAHAHYARPKGSCMRTTSRTIIHIIPYRKHLGCHVVQECSTLEWRIKALIHCMREVAYTQVVVFAKEDVLWEERPAGDAVAKALFSAC